ncbi:MAG: transcriptional repressor [Candidatus Gastranaerophilales bacterium]|nr:transcriptional repressor [Candidatus Gastranaerophilales bacterium]
MDNFSDKNSEYFNKLRGEGYRITPQRSQLLEFFQQLPEGEHLSAEELYVRLVDRKIKISLATLYRSLKFLVSKGFLRELDFGEEHKFYELSSPGKQHHHLVCSICGKTTEFEDKSIYEQALRIARESNNFKIMDYHFKIFGICNNCRNQKL